MSALKRRIHKLEAQIEVRQPAYSLDVKAARTRAAARVRLYIGERLNVASHPAVQSACALLIGDTPAQAATDLELLQRWGRQHPDALAPDEGTLARITAKLEAMAQRLEAQG
jgi:hypothetical protein